MKKGIIYLLMSIFLLFTVENKQSQDFQQDSESQNISSQLFSFAKKHHLDKSLEKASFQQINDSLDSPEEINFNFSNSINTIAVFAVVGLGYLLHLYFRRTKKNFHEPQIIICSVKRFILLRSIRI